MDELTVPKNKFRLTEICDYQVSFQVVQNPNKTWLPCLQIYPASDNVGLIEDGEVFADTGVVEKVTNLDAAMIYGREPYSQWEYAAEAAVDTIEALGFQVHDKPHYFEVIFWDENTYSRRSTKGMSDGIDFKLIQE